LEERVLRTTASATQAGDWALVLTSAGIEHRVDEHDHQFALVVSAADAEVAGRAIDEFEAEGAPEVPPPAPDNGPSSLGVLSAICFGAFFIVTGTRAEGSRWFDLGSASAEQIANGAWWRAVTALTLHADLLHLAGNVVASLVFVTALGRWLGTGLGGAVMLAVATVANLLTAAVHRTAFVSVGASTATFAALGLVAGLQVARRLRLRTRRGYAWVPIGAGLGLYAMLGVGAGADIYAHLFGLGLGVAAGLTLALRQISRGGRVPGIIGQALLGTAAVAAVASCWLLAFRAAR
jgi:membrane associated rhomboid family serine protease